VTEKRPFVIGLTGSIGMGKTETAKLFQRAGIPVYHADAVVHGLYDIGGAAVKPIGDSFPGVVENGRVNREKLASIAAGDEAAFKRLESIVHPLVREEQRKFLAEAARQGAEFTVLDIPLLFETGQQDRMDAVVVASAPAAVQRTRVFARPGMSEEKFAVMLARQWSDAEKRAKADFVIETDKGLDHAYEQVKQVIEALRRKQSGMR
jgi:dephospho-CoA kinase